MGGGRSVAQADAELPRRGDQHVVAVQGPGFAPRPSRARTSVGCPLPNDEAVGLARRNQVHGISAERAREDPVERARRAAALYMSEHGDARFRPVSRAMMSAMAAPTP